MVIIKKLLSGRRGQALVETALMLPILILILMGIVEFGRILNAYLIITNASREGARCAVVHSTDVEIQSAVNNLTSTLNQSDVTLTITPDFVNRTSGSSVTVTVDYSINIITPLMRAIIPNPYPINSTTVMRAE